MSASKVTDWEANIIRKLYAAGEHSQRAIAALHGITPLAVFHILKGK